MPREGLPGTYALVLLAESPFNVRVGKLGILNGRSGYYVYIGSAFGPGGLQARVKRHLKAASRPHWHIDYVRQILPIVEVWYTTDDNQKYEHQWASVMANMAGSSVLLPRFGASDCTCRTHLFYFDRAPSWQEFHRYCEKRWDFRCGIVLLFIQ